MAILSRTDRSLLGHWWWTVDRIQLVALSALIIMGLVLAMAATPPVAERIGLDPFYFAFRQFIFLPIALLLAITVSLLSIRGVRRLALVIFICAIFLLTLTPVFGEEIKGASRWISLGGISVQASEFVKPGFAIVTAWAFARWRIDDRFPGHWIATGLFLFIASLLIFQPDIGQTIILGVIWSVQFFLAGLPLILLALFGMLALIGAVMAYFTFDHVQSRVDRFLDLTTSNGFQVESAMQAFLKGGILGRGPGEGRIKEILPDAHADFIFAVVGEEFGLIACLILVFLFSFIVLRGFFRVFNEKNLFTLLAVTGLLAQFGLQAMINMASTLHLIPPKGMTLPFISYGGSSAIASALGMGMMLALTRRNSVETEFP